MTRVTMELLPDGVRRKIVVHYGHITDVIFFPIYWGRRSLMKYTILLHRVSLVTVSRMLYQHTMLI